MKHKLQFRYSVTFNIFARTSYRYNNSPAQPWNESILLNEPKLRGWAFFLDKIYIYIFFTSMAPLAQFVSTGFFHTGIFFEIAHLPSLKK